MTHKSFKDFLSYRHMELHPTILDDDLPNAFDDWITELSPEEWIALGEEYGKTQKGVIDLDEALI